MPDVNSLRLLIIFACILLGGTSVIKGQSPGTKIAPVSESEFPYNQAPISYSARKPDDAISRLRKRLDDGTVTISAKGEQGYLLDLLGALQIPVSSQLLVFSKTSANARLITPKTPRAIYFNDDVYVGWVPGSQMIEISTVDPQVGGIFYHVKQPPGESKNQEPISSPSFVRDESCLLCHISRNSLRIPGHLVRSFTTDSEGQMRTGFSRVTHETPYDNRWAGWYVTGQMRRLKHLGNVFGDDQKKSSTETGPNSHSSPGLSQYCDIKRYLVTTSDVIPHLVLEHQAHGHNLITRLNYEAQFNRPLTAAEPLLRYLLFLDEPPLTEVIHTRSDYLKQFEARGLRDKKGRSLREFDLQSRLFKYRMSYLIYSPAFDALPDVVRAEFLQQLKTFLTTTDRQHPAARLTADERKSILEILRETKPGLPKGW